MNTALTVPDRPNPRASIALICPYPFFFYNNYSVYESLLPDVEIIPDPPSDYRGVQFPPEERQRFYELLDTAGVSWRSVEHADCTPQEFFSKYHTLVGNMYEGWMRHPVNERKRKVRVFYGVAKDVWMYGQWSVHFDLTCTPGLPFAQKLVELYDSSVVVTGEPKFDYHNESLERELKADLLKQSGGKPILLIGATWGELSSLEILLPYLLRLQEEYLVVVKIHHMTSIFSPVMQETLTAAGMVVYDQYTPTVSLLRCVDYVISDNSSLMFDAVQLEVPLVLIDFIGPYDEVFVNDKPFVGLVRSKGLGVGAVTSESPEQVAKQPGQELAPVVKLYQQIDFETQYKGLKQALQQATLETFRSRQQQYKEKYFAPRSELAGKKIAAAIKNLIDQGPRHTTNALRKAVWNDFEARITGILVKKQEALVQQLYAELHEYTSLRALPFIQRYREIVKRFF